MLEKPEGKRQFGKPRHARENDIQMNLNKIQQKGMDQIHMTGTNGRLI